MAVFDKIIKKAKQQQTNRNAVNMYSAANTGRGTNSAYSSTYRPDVLQQTQQANAAGVRYTDPTTGEQKPLTYGGVLDALVPRGVTGAQSGPNLPPSNNKQPGASGGSGGRRGYGGGGGGGGGGSAAAAAQSQLDAILAMLGSQTWKAPPMTDVRNAIAARQGGVDTAYNQDMATLTGAYDNADAFMAGLKDPYADLRFERARVATEGNPWLTSQGAPALNVLTENPDDTWSGFENTRRLSSAGQQAWNQSSQAGTRQARAAGVSGIGALRNAYNDSIQQQLASVAQQEYQNQLALDNAKREAYISAVLPLLGAGATAPGDILAQMGWAPPAPAADYDPEDPLGWKKIAGLV